VTTSSGNRNGGTASSNRIGKVPQPDTYSKQNLNISRYNRGHDVQIKKGDIDNKWGLDGVNSHSRSSLGFYNGTMPSRVNIVEYYD
jgi:hypothetical protein